MSHFGRKKWRTLENTAKIFPATSGKKDERVFRMSCQLKEEVNPEKLQRALDLCIEDFSLFLCVLRCGVFWNYLEETELRPKVREEYKPPCSQLYFRDQKNLLFEVTYYKYRINFETYHALTDGTGALQFLKSLVYYYLIEAYPEEVKGPVSQIQADATAEEMAEDSFDKYYSAQGSQEDIPKYKAHQLRYHRLEYGQLRLVEGIFPTSMLLERARNFGTTATVFLTAVLLCAIAKDMSPRQKKRPVALMIPVNLRSYFPSDSARNFFGWIDIGYDFANQSDKLEDVIAFTSDFFKKELTPGRIAARMNALMKMEKNPFMRILPLPVKLWGMQVGAALSTSADTAIFSNIGRITMPDECVPYIDWFDFYTSTPKIELCMCSWQDKMSVSFTSAYANSRIERNFFRMLAEYEIPVEIIATGGGEGGGWDAVVHQV